MKPETLMLLGTGLASSIAAGFIVQAIVTANEKRGTAVVSFWDGMGEPAQAVHVVVSRASDSIVVIDMNTGGDNNAILSLSPGTYELVAESMDAAGLPLFATAPFEVQVARDTVVKVTLHPLLSRYARVTGFDILQEQATTRWRSQGFPDPLIDKGLQWAHGWAEGFADYVTSRSPTLAPYRQQVEADLFVTAVPLAEKWMKGVAEGFGFAGREQPQGAWNQDWMIGFQHARRGEAPRPYTATYPAAYNDGYSRGVVGLHRTETSGFPTLTTGRESITRW